ncbi:MAG: hypothetical protein EA377_03235 [Phycisphaerales bacterium]|nr:MAG: hypothetical protein EA377_03235 [Phycisphaerales bacterium]
MWKEPVDDSKNDDTKTFWFSPPIARALWDRSFGFNRHLCHDDQQEASNYEHDTNKIPQDANRLGAIVQPPSGSTVESK